MKRNQSKRRDYFRKWRALNKDKIKRYQEQNREKSNAYRREWSNNNPEKDAVTSRKQNLKRKYGLTLEDYDILLKEQDYKCKICSFEETAFEFNSQRIKSLAVDHDHKTNKVRGLLCHKCNLGLGHFNDDINLLQSAIKYLDVTQCERNHKSK